MDSASQHSPKRLLRVLIAGGVLAAAWLAVDAITHSEPAAAAQSYDILPNVGSSGGGVVNGLLGSTTTLVTNVVTPVTSAVTPVVTPVVTTVTAPVTPVITEVVNPVVTTVVAPVATPVITAVVTPVAPIVTGITSPIGQIVTTVTTPLSPVLTPITSVVGTVAGPVLGSLETIVAPVGSIVLQPLASAVEPLTVIDVAADLAQVTQTVPTMIPNGTVLAAGGAVILGAVLAALVTPLLPAPSNGGPLNVPLAPAAPTGSNGSSSVALYGELNSGVPAGIGAFGTGGADVDDLPSSPTFASDTTPD